jgi:hypothetical protein
LGVGDPEDLLALLAGVGWFAMGEPVAVIDLPGRVAAWAGTAPAVAATTRVAAMAAVKIVLTSRAYCRNRASGGKTPVLGAFHPIRVIGPGM